MYKELEIRCRKLGHQVPFAYCYKEGGDIPCPRVLDCWQIYFPVDAYLREKLTQEQWERCFCKEPKQKIATLLELIEQAKMRKQTSE